MPNGLFQFAFIGPGGSEVVVVMLVLLLLFGAKDAPRMFRKLNDMLTQLRSMADNFRREVMYSDLGGEDEPQHTAGKYDEYGLDDNDRQEEEVESAEVFDETDAASGSEINTDGGPGDKGEDGDVQKT